MSGEVDWWTMRARDVLDGIVEQGLTDGKRDGTSEESNKAGARAESRNACQ